MANKPGEGTPEVGSTDVLLASTNLIAISITLTSDARDYGNSPVTTLRKGLLLGKRTSDGKYSQFYHMTELSSGYSAGANTLSVDSNQGFEAGDTLIVTDGTNTEYPVIDSLSGITEIVLTYALTNSYAEDSDVVLKDGTELSADVVVLPDKVKDIDDADMISDAYLNALLYEDKVVGIANLTKSSVQRLMFK